MGNLQLLSQCSYSLNSHQNHYVYKIFSSNNTSSSNIKLHNTMQRPLPFFPTHFCSVLCVPTLFLKSKWFHFSSTSSIFLSCVIGYIVPCHCCKCSTIFLYPSYKFSSNKQYHLIQRMTGWTHPSPFVFNTDGLYQYLWT